MYIVPSDKEQVPLYSPNCSVTKQNQHTRFIEVAVVHHAHGKYKKRMPREANVLQKHKKVSRNCLLKNTHISYKKTV